MVEVTKEDRKVNVVDEKWIDVTLTITERYDAEEFLRELTKMESEIKHIKESAADNIKAREVALKQIKPSKGIAEKIRNYEIEKAKEEREKATQ